MLAGGTRKELVMSKIGKGALALTLVGGLAFFAEPSWAVESDVDSTAGPQLPAPRTSDPDFQQDDQPGALLNPEVEGANPTRPDVDQISVPRSARVLSIACSQSRVIAISVVGLMTAIISAATPASPAFAHGWHCHPAWHPARGWHRHWQACGPHWRPPGWPRFGPPGRAGFQCPPPGRINCMPPVRPELGRLCRPDFIDWARRHCPGFDVVY